MKPVFLMFVFLIILGFGASALQTAPTTDSVLVYDHTGPFVEWIQVYFNQARTASFTIGSGFNGYEPTGYSVWLYASAAGTWTIFSGMQCGGGTFIYSGGSVQRSAAGNFWITFTQNYQMDNPDFVAGASCGLTLEVTQGDKLKLAWNYDEGYAMGVWGAPPSAPAPPPSGPSGPSDPIIETGEEPGTPEDTTEDTTTIPTDSLYVYALIAVGFIALIIIARR